MLDYRLNESPPVQTQQQAVDTETQKQARIEQTPKRKGVTLRRRLLTTVLPVVLAPLAIAGGLSWYLTQQRSTQQAELRLWNEALLTSDVVNELLKDAFKVPTVLANDPLIINTARTSGTQAEAAGLHQLPIEQVENRFAATKLLQPNQALNNYLSRDAKIGNLAELFFTDRNGFNIASSNPTSDFVQRDEKWWQEGKSKGQALGQPEFDESSKTTALDLMRAIKDPASGKFLGVIKGVFSITNLEELESLWERLGASGSEQIQVLSVREGGTIINTVTAEGSSNTREVIGGKAVLQKATALIAELKSQDVNFDTKEGRSTSYISNAEQLQGLNITPWTHETGDRALTTLFTYNGRRYAMATTPDTDWVAIASVDLSDIAAAGNDLGLTFIVIFLVLAAVAGLIISYLARQLSAPLGKLAGTTEQFTSGNLNTYAQPSGTRETQALAQNFNNLATRVKTLLAEQEKSASQQLVIQQAAAHQQAENAEQQKLAKETLQKSALDLLVEVDPVSRGDLTIRASVTENEIGTIADSYNATIASLRKIVIQVQGAAGQMAATTSSSEVSVQGLSTEALRQTEEITAALARIGEMSKSIRAVAMSAELAEAAVKEANQTVEAGDAAMNRTVDGILAIRETVAETATKVKQLGDSSQKISKVVNLIGTFAAQTNLLALKASIEAARAGEEGRGFAVLADEVRILARQSAQATSEIESLVTGIQAETNEVVAAMEAGTQQVVTGTRLVDETRQSLNKITAVSGQIGSLVEAIASAAMVQTQTSEDVTQSMSDVAAIARQTSNEASTVSASFKELLAVAQQLQVSAGQFKVS